MVHLKGPSFEIKNIKNEILWSPMGNTNEVYTFVSKRQNVVPVLYLREISHYVESFGVVFGHYIEEEWISVIVEGFVVQEALGKQTQVLGVRL